MATETEVGVALVNERLAACVNVIGEVRSFCRWDGGVEEDAEILLVAKARAERSMELAARVQELHPYDLPEILELPVVGGSEGYLKWVEMESRS